MLDRTLVETLKYIQSRDQLTNEQFAQRIGIHEVSWSRIKNFKKGIGDKTRKGICHAYPELKEAVIDNYLVRDINRTAPEPTHNGKRDGFGAKVKGFILRLFQRG